MKIRATVATLVGLTAGIAALPADARVAVTRVSPAGSGPVNIAVNDTVTFELRMNSIAGETLFGLGFSAHGYNPSVLQFNQGRGIRRYLNDGGGTFLSNIAGTSSGGAPATQQRVLAQNQIGAFGPRVQMALSASIDEVFPDVATPDPGLEGGTTPMFRLVFQGVSEGTTTINFDTAYQGDGVIIAGGGAVPGTGFSVTVNVPEPTAVAAGATALASVLGLAAVRRRL